MGQIAAIASGIQAVAGLAQAGAAAKAAMQQAQIQAQQIAYQAAAEEQNLLFQANSQRQEALRQQLESKQLETARQDELVAASQEETARLRELRETLSTVASIRANRGLRVSPTARAITKDIRQTAENDIRTNLANRMGRAESLRLQSSYAGSLSDFSTQTASFYGQQAALTRSSAETSIRSTLKAGKNAARQSLFTGVLNFGTSIARSNLFKGTQTGGSLAAPLKNQSGYNVGTYKR